MAEVNVFGFFDDRDRRGFQAALHRADGTARPAAQAVRDALQETTPCAVTAPWGPATAVVGARAPRIVAGARQIVVTPQVGEGVLMRMCAYPRSVSPSTASRLPARAGGRASVCVSGKATPGRLAALVLLRRPWMPRGGTLGLRFIAETNSERTSSYGARFR